MTIDGVSPATGAGRRVELAADGSRLRLTFRDGRSGTPLRTVAIPADALMTVLADQPAGRQRLTGTGTLTVEVRKNEVVLAAGGPDAAVGLDDLVEAVAAAFPDGGAA